MKIIAYYRVSTRGQRRSGLGLDAQREAVAAYAREHGATIIGEYTEAESGKRSDRPQLAQALGHARSARGRLVVAKLDRLSRNVAFLAALMESKVDFIACDMPFANTLTLHIMAAVAEAEAKATSQRTVDALRAAKRRGIKLGSSRPGHWRGREDRRRLGLKRAQRAAIPARVEAARRAYAFILPLIQERRQAGDSLAAIAERVNASGHLTRRGLPFTGTMVHRLLVRS